MNNMLIIIVTMFLIIKLCTYSYNADIIASSSYAFNESRINQFMYIFIIITTYIAKKHIE